MRRFGRDLAVFIGRGKNQGSHRDYALQQAVHVIAVPGRGALALTAPIDCHTTVFVLKCGTWSSERGLRGGEVVGGEDQAGVGREVGGGEVDVCLAELASDLT